MSAPKVFNIFNRPEAKKSASGTEIYKWNFLDKDGKVQTDEKNIKEEINSYLPTVDYKTQIKRGELDEPTLSTVSRDYTNLPDNTVDYIKFLNNLANMDEKQVSNLMEQVKQSSKNSVQTKQDGNSSENNGGGTPPEAVQKQSNNSNSNTEINGGTN